MKHTKIIVFTIISFLFVSKSNAYVLRTSDDTSRKGSDNPSVTLKVEVAASPDEKGMQLPNLEGSGDPSVTLKVQVAANPIENCIQLPNLQGSGGPSVNSKVQIAFAANPAENSKQLTNLQESGDLSGTSKVQIEASPVENGMQLPNLLGVGNPSVTLKAQVAANPDEIGIQLSNIQGNGNSKLKNIEALSPTNAESKKQNSGTEEIDHPLKNEDLKRQSEKVETSDQSIIVEKNADRKSEEGDDLPTVIETNTQNSNEEEVNHKISLSDVNSYSADQSHGRPTKRDTWHVELLGLPHDASYFFDDLEPFISNNSDSRVGRAAPLHEIKSHRTKLSGKTKENLEDYLEEQEDDVENDEDENNDEEECEYDDYDDDEECETSTTCPPTTTTCPPSTTTCPPTTTTCPPTTTTCPPTTTTCAPSTTTCPTTTKCTTKSTCKTTHNKCTTKCPRICAKGRR